MHTLYHNILWNKVLCRVCLLFAINSKLLHDFLCDSYQQRDWTSREIFVFNLLNFCVYLLKYKGICWRRRKRLRRTSSQTNVGSIIFAVKNPCVDKAGCQFFIKIWKISLTYFNVLNVILNVKPMKYYEYYNLITNTVTKSVIDQSQSGLQGYRGRSGGVD